MSTGWASLPCYSKIRVPMCTLAIFRDVSEQLPLVVAANRDEFLARPADAPASLADVPGVMAGRDREAGGTWLGARSEGGVLVAGLLNRRAADGSVPATTTGRSRGLLCLDALGAMSVDEAKNRILEPGPALPPLSHYSGFNLLLADLDRAVVIDNGDSTRTTELDSGLSVLTNLDVNDPRCPRLASAVPRFEEVAAALSAGLDLGGLVDALQVVLSSHESSLDPDGRSELSKLCIHAGEYGTRSSTILAYDDGGALHYFHAAGAPCSSTYQRIPV